MSNLLLKAAHKQKESAQKKLDKLKADFEEKYKAKAAVLEAQIKQAEEYILENEK